jgi:hypothetical protein
MDVRPSATLLVAALAMALGGATTAPAEACSTSKPPGYESVADAFAQSASVFKGTSIGGFWLPDWVSRRVVRTFGGCPLYWCRAFERALRSAVAVVEVSEVYKGAAGPYLLVVAQTNCDFLPNDAGVEQFFFMEAIGPYVVRDSTDVEHGEQWLDGQGKGHGYTAFRNGAVAEKDDDGNVMGPPDSVTDASHRSAVTADFLRGKPVIAKVSTLTEAVCLGVAAVAWMRVSARGLVREATQRLVGGVVTLALLGVEMEP